MKKWPGVNFWTKVRMELPPFNTHAFHRVEFQGDDVIIGFFEFGSRTAETLTIGDVGFLTAYFFPHVDFEAAALAYDIVGREAVHNPLPNMHDTFLRIRKGGGAA